MTYNYGKIVLCIFIDTDSGVEFFNEIFCRLPANLILFLWLREDYLSDGLQIQGENVFISYYNKDNIINCIETSCNFEGSSLTGIILENGDVENLRDNICNLFPISINPATILDKFNENPWLGAILPVPFLASNHFIKNQQNIRLNKAMASNKFIFSPQGLECAILCQTDVLKKILDPENPDVRWIPYLIQNEGYMVGRCIRNSSVQKNLFHLYDLNSRQINAGLNYMKVDVDNFNAYMGELSNLLSGYHKLYKRVQNLNKHNKDLSQKIKQPEIREIPVVVDIGIKGAVKNWLKKFFNSSGKGN